jgi:hypothetical protein
LGDVAKASHDNWGEGRVVERLIADALRPIRKAAWDKFKTLFRSAHENNWDERNIHK